MEEKEVLVDVALQKINHLVCKPTCMLLLRLNVY